MTDALIWRESECVMDIEDRIDRSLYEASTIGILYPYDIFSVIMLCPEVRIEGSSEITYMDRSCRGWSETGADHRVILREVIRDRL
jgi:hypothetical protein